MLFKLFLSLLGHRDSELSVVIRDDERIPVPMASATVIFFKAFFIFSAPAPSFLLYSSIRFQHPFAGKISGF